MQYTMFHANGTPTRATVAVQNWLLDCRFQPGAAQPAAGHSLVAHELTHVVNQGTTVRAWHVSKYSSARGALPARAAFRAPVAGAQFLPEVDDEVLVAFEHATPRATAIVFNPTELTLKKTTPWQTAGRGDVGMIRAGNYRVVISQRTGIQPLSLALVVADDAALQRNVRVLRVV